jgi:hypothetical protein
MKNKPKVWLGSSKENDPPITIPAFYLILPAVDDEPKKTLLVSLNLPLDKINQELGIFTGFVTLWEAYAQESGYEFDYDKDLYEKTDEGWKVVNG